MLVKGYAGQEEQVSDFHKGSPPIQSSWDKWYHVTNVEQGITIHEYSPWALRYERNMEKLSGYGYLVSFIVHACLFLKFIGLLPAKTTIHDFLIIMVSIVFLGLCLMSAVVAAKRFKGSKKLIAISIDSINVTGEYSDHTVKKINLEDIKNISLKMPYEIQLKFNNGEIWKFLDRFSYWPILRNHILEKTAK